MSTKNFGFKCLDVAAHGDYAIVKVFCEVRTPLENLSDVCKFAQKSASEKGLAYNGVDVGSDSPYAVDAENNEITMTFGGPSVPGKPAGYVQDVKLRRTI